MKALMMLKVLYMTTQETIEMAGRLRFLACHIKAGMERMRAKKDATRRITASPDAEL